MQNFALFFTRFLSWCTHPLPRRATRPLVAFALTVLCAATSAHAARIVYVKSGASGNGSSWASAYGNLSTALTAAKALNPTAGDPVEIWITAGTYKPDAPALNPDDFIFETDPRLGTFSIPSHVKLIGSFSATAPESSVGARTLSDTSAMTVLSGDIGQPYTATTAPTTRATALAAVQLDPENTTLQDNVTNVVTITNSVGVTLQSLIITGGYAVHRETTPEGDVLSMAKPNPRDPINKLALNTFGGSDMKVRRQAAGGGIFIESDTVPTGTNLTIDGCYLVQNHALGFGGALAILRAQIECGSTWFVANSAVDAGGAIWGRAQSSNFYGGAMLRNVSGNGGAVQLNQTAMPLANWADTRARFLFGNDIFYGANKVNDDISRANIAPSITSQSGLLSIEDSTGRLIGVAVSVAQDAAINALGSTAVSNAMIGVDVVSYTVLASDILVFALQDQGVNNAYTKYWSEEFAPMWRKMFTPQGWIDELKYTYFSDAKMNKDIAENDVRFAYGEFINKSRPTRFVGVRFDHNIAHGDGGALFAVHANYVAERCLFTENDAAGDGGAIAQRAYNKTQIVNSVFSANGAKGYSAISLASNARARILNCTIVDNTSGAASGYAVGVELGAELNLTNSVLWGNHNPTTGSVQGGADIFTSLPKNLSKDVRKCYDEAIQYRFLFVGTTDIFGCNIESLSTLENAWGLVDIGFTKAVLLSGGLEAAAQIRQFADANSAHDALELYFTGSGNRYLYDRGNISVDPIFHDGWLPGPTSPVINRGSLDSYGLVFSGLSEQLDFLGAARTYAANSISMGAVQSPTASDGSATAESVGRYFVTPTGAGDKTGRNWANASDDLKTMMAKDGAEVWVALGTYYPSKTGDRFASFSLGKSTRVYGGFAGTETVFADRDLVNNLATLSGQLSEVPGNASAGQSYHVIKQQNTEGALVLDGFIVRKGKADGTGEPQGGGAYLGNTAFAFANVTFRDCTATNEGGAIYAAGERILSITDCKFESNVANTGGALYSVTTLLMDRSRFTDNRSTLKGGAVAAMASNAAGQKANFYNSVFARNSSTNSGAGSAIYVNVLSNEIRNCTITQNSGYVNRDQEHYGSAVYFDGVSGILQNSILTNNGSTAFTASGLPVELASIHITAEDQLGFFFAYSLVEGLQTTSFGGGSVRVKGDYMAGFTKISTKAYDRNDYGEGAEDEGYTSTFYAKIPGLSNSYVDNCLDTDPGFVNAVQLDLRLGSRSVAINRGENRAMGWFSLDANNLPRQVGTKVDLGAHEFQGTTNSVYSIVTATRTITDDGPVYSFTFHPENPLTSDATFAWMVNKNDGRGFVALPTDARISGTNSSVLVLTQPPGEWNGWSFRVTVGGSNTAVASAALTGAANSRYYVNGAVTASGNGKSWATAFKTLQEALAANSGVNASDYCQIWVAQGTYVPNRNGTGKQFTLYSGMVLYGGFKGDETAQSQRNPALYPTILDGAQPGAKEIYDYSNYLLSITTYEYIPLSAVLDGFTLRSALYQAVTINTQGNALPAKISNCIIENEKGTGALIGGPATFKNVTFRKNKLSGAKVSAGNVVFESSLFTQNSGSEGAALSVSGGNVTLTKTTIADNFASLRTGGVDITGGTVTVERSILFNNRDNATELGATLEPAQLKSKNATLTVTHSLIEGLVTFTTGGNFGYHPLFTDPLTQNYTLSANSPAIALSAGAYPFVGTPKTTFNLLTLPASSEERTSLFSKTFSYTWPSGAGYIVNWEIDRGNGFVGADVAGLPFTLSTAATGSTLVVTNTGGAILPSFRVRANLQTVQFGALTPLPVVTLKVIPPVIRYVNADAATGGNGLSWATAFRTYEEAYNKLPSDNVELWFKKGTYTLKNQPIVPGVTIYGGFAGTETSLSQRSLTSANTTFLNEVTVTSGQGHNIAGNYYPSLVLGRQVVLDGVQVVTNANTAGLYLIGGGGVYRNCDFVGANTRNAVIIQSAQPTFENCSFVGPANAAVAMDRSAPVFRSSRFINSYNSANGGAITATFSDLIIDRCTFDNNRTYSQGGAIYATGGSLTITNTLFTNNRAGDQGGAIATGANLELVNCTFANNRTSKQEGAGLYYWGQAHVANSIFWGNRGAVASRSTANAMERYQFASGGGSLAIEYSIVEGLLAFAGNNNQPFNPLFVGSGAQPFAVIANSPAIDAGKLSALDILAPVIAYPGRVTRTLDLGAFESAAAVSNIIKLTSAPAPVSTYNGSNLTFTVAGENFVNAALGNNVVWERYVNGAWTVITNGNGYTITTTNSSSTLNVNNTSADKAGDYRYRIPSLGFYAPGFNVNVQTRRVVHVDEKAASGGNGATWGTAFKTLDAALASGSGLEVRVAAGLYTPTRLVLTPGVLFRGGYGNSGSAAQRDVRNVNTNLTRITGGNMVYADGSGGEFDFSTGFEGFTFTPQGSNSIWITKSAIVLFRDCVFADFGSPSVSNAVLIDFGASGIFEDCLFRNNAGILLKLDQYGYAQVSRSVVRNNLNTWLYVGFMGSTIIEDTTFTDNTAGVGNAATQIYEDRYLIKLGNAGGTEPPPRSLIQRSQFTKNSGTYQIEAGGPLVITDSLFDHNTGPAITVSGDLSLRHVTIADNSVLQQITNTGTPRSVPLIRQHSGALQIVSSIFWNNRSLGSGNSIEIQQIERAGGSLDLRGSILEGYSTLGGTQNRGVNPLFVDADNGNYRLDPYSPATFNGVYAYLTDYDLAGTSRPASINQGLHLGAYTFAGYPGGTYLAPISLGATPKTTPVFLRSAGTLTVNGLVGSTVNWFRWTGTAAIPLDASDARFVITNTATSSTLTLNNIAATDTVGFVYTITGTAFRSPVTYLTPTVRPRVYVDAASAATNGDGSTWANASRYLSHAYKYAPDNAEIWVKAGTYESYGTEFVLRPGVELYGGFTTNATDFTQRDLTGELTIISGRVRSADANRNTLVDGVTFTSTTFGLVLSGNASPIIRRSVFRDSTYSGSVLISDAATPLFEDCKFRNNGPASIAMSNGDATVTRGDFTGTGRAFNSTGGKLTITNSLFHDFRSANGMMLVSQNPAAEVIIDLSTVRDNTGPDLIQSYAGTLTFRNSLIRGNHSSYQGLIVVGRASSVTRGTVEILQSTVYGNDNTNGTGGIYLYDGALVAQNSIFWNNRSRRTGLSLEQQQVHRAPSDAQSTATVSLTSSIVEGFASLGGTGNFADAPLFVDASAGDFRLSSISPAIDAGNPSPQQTGYDLGGYPRTWGAAPDLGAHEFYGTPDAPLRIVRSPTSLDSAVNGTATFVAESATAGTFVWQVETAPGVWSTLTTGGIYTITVNGNTSTLTITPTTAAEHGLRFRYTFGAVNSTPFVLSVVSKRVIYVDVGATGAINGTTWATAFRNMNEALANWSPGAEIWVSRKSTVRLTTPMVLEDGMKLYGGFAGTENALEQRSALAQTLLEPETISQLCFVDQTGHPLTRDTLIDGFTFRAKAQERGLILQAANLTVRNSTFTNFYSAAVDNTSSSPLFENCLFTRNADGAIRDTASASEIVSCRFENNWSRFQNDIGSALRIDGNLSGQITTVRDTIFRSNTHSAVSVRNGSADFDRCTWTANTNFQASALYVLSTGTAAVRNSVIAGNTATVRGGWYPTIVTNDGTLSLTNVTFAGNTAAAWNTAGSVLVNSRNLTVTNSIFWANTVANNVVNTSVEQQNLQNLGTGVVQVSSTLLPGLSLYVGDHNFDFSPVFDPNFPDEYRLSAFSPAVNAGDNTAIAINGTDVTGAHRLVGTTVDLGAREFTGTADLTPIKISASSSGAFIPVWSTAPGTFTVNADNSVIGRILWETQVDGQWVALPAGGDFSQFNSGTTSTLTVAAPASDDIADRYVRFRVLGGSTYVSETYTVTTARSNVRYVNAYAPAGGNGQSWATAFTTIADAVAGSPSHTELWIAQGTYADTTQITLPSALRFYGGFRGNETSRNNRQTDRTQTAIANTLLIPNALDTALFDTLTMRANAITVQHRPTVFRNVKFENGATLSSNYARSLLLEDCLFTNNAAPVFFATDSGTIRRTTFTNNQRALQLMGSSWLIEDSKFETTSAFTPTGGTQFLSSIATGLVVKRTSFLNANAFSPAINLSTGGVSDFFDCTFSGNKTTQNGPGLLNIQNATARFDRCAFINNKSLPLPGIAIASAAVLRAQAGATVSVRNSYFGDNQTTSASFSAAGAGTISIEDSTATFIGVTLVNNSATLQETAGIVLTNSTGTIANSILFGNTAIGGSVENRQLKTANSTLTIHHTLIDGLATFTGPGLSGHNPRLIGVAGRLLPGTDSPARNVGDNSVLLTGETDLLGAARTSEDLVDLGAIEPTTASTTVTLDLALSRRVVGGYLEITYDNTRNYAGLVWQINTGTGWQNVVVPSGADTTNGTLRTLRLPWSPELYEGASLRLLGTDYTSTNYIVAYGTVASINAVVTASFPGPGTMAPNAKPNLSFTYDQALANNAVNNSSWIVHGFLQGRLLSSRWGTVSNDLLQPNLTTGITFKPGEIVDATSTAGIVTALGGTAKPYVMRFSLPNVSRNGKFRRSDSLATTGNITGASAGDINGDGNNDVMFVGDEGAWIYLGDGEGNFTRLQYAATGQWNAFALADFNGDGRPDFVGSRGNSSLTIETIDTAGGIATNILTASLAYSGRRLLPGDFNGDGKQDLLVLGGAETLLLNNGDGTFTATAQTFAPAGDATREAAIGDIDRDGDLDFIQVRGTSGDIYSWINDGTGQFTTGTTLKIAGTQTMVFTDLNLDGWPDLAIAGGTTNDTIHIYTNDKTGQFVRRYSFAAGKVVQLAAADFDGNRTVDLLAITGNSVDTVWSNNGYASFSSAAATWTSTGATATAQVAVADLNGDGAADVALPQGSRVHFWMPGNYFAGFTKTLAEATTLTFTQADFTGSTTENVATGFVRAVDSYVITSLPTHGTLKANGVAVTLGQKLTYLNNAQPLTLTYTPTGHYYGTDSFKVAPVDFVSTSPSGRVTLAISRVIDGPTAEAQSVKLFKNHARTFTLSATHPEGEALVFAISQQPAHGTAALTGRSVIYTPNNDYVGSDSFVFTAADAFGNTAGAGVALSISDTIETVSTTDASGPGSLANALAAIVTQGGSGRIAFDSALAGQTLELSVATDTAHGPTAALITGDLEIDGTAAAGLKIKRAASTAELRLFRVTSTGSLRLKNLELIDGLVRSESASLPARGAAIYNEGTISSENVILRNHYAHGLTTTGAEGGALYNAGGTLTFLNVDFIDNHAEDDSGNGSGGGLFLRNGSVDFTDSGLISNQAPTTGAAAHFVGDNGAVVSTWTNTRFQSLSVARIGTGTVAIIDRNIDSPPLPNITPVITRVTVGQINGNHDETITLNSPTATLSFATADTEFYRGDAGVPQMEIIGTEGLTRTLRFTPGGNSGGVTNVLLTAIDDGISYTNQFTVGFLTAPFVAPTVADQDVYAIDGNAVLFTLTGTHDYVTPVTFEILTQPEHGTISGTVPNLMYTPEPGYEGVDYLIYRANTEQNLAASARITLRNVRSERRVTSAEPTGPGSLAEVLAHAPRLNTQDWRVVFDSSLAGKTLELPEASLQTPAGPSAFFIDGNVELDGTDAPGLTIRRGDDAAEMRLFYVSPSGNLKLRNLTLANGLAAGADGQAGRGGAVYLDRDDNYAASLDAVGVTFDHHVALGGTGANGEGGAIYSHNGSVGLKACVFTHNSALGGAGGTGRGGAIFDHNGLLYFHGDVADPESTFANNLAAQGAEVFLVADGDLQDLYGPMMATFFKANITGLGTSLINDGALTVRSYFSTVSGPGVVSIAPIAYTEVSGLDKLSLVVGSAPDSILVDVDGSLESGWFTLTGTMAAPVLRVEPTTGGAGGMVKLAAVQGNYRFERDVLLSTYDYYGPTTTTQYLDTPVNTPRALILDVIAPANNVLSYTITTPPQHGVLSGTAPNLTYTPNANFASSDSFEFQVTDELDYVATGHVEIDVRGGSVDAADLKFIVQNDVSSPIVLTGSVQTYGVALTYEPDQPTHGTLTGAGPNLVYTPPVGFTGTDEFYYFAVDAYDNFDRGHVTILVGDVAGDAAPVLSGQAPVRVTYRAGEGYGYAVYDPLHPEDSAFNALQVTDSDHAETITVTVTLPADRISSFGFGNHAADWIGVDDEDPYAATSIQTAGTLAEVTARLRDLTIGSQLGDYTLVPNLGDFRDFNVVVTLSDVLGKTSSYDLPVNFVHGGSTPVGGDFTFYTDKNQPLTFTLPVTQAENAPLTFSTFISPTLQGALTGTGPVFTYTPPTDFTGEDGVPNEAGLPGAFFYRAAEPGGRGDGGFVRLIVNTPPVGVADTTTRGTNAKFITTASLLANDTDADTAAGDTLSITAVSPLSANGIAVTLAGGTITYAASASTADDSFTYTLSDARQSTQTVTVTVLYDNTAPVAQDDTLEREYGLPLQINSGILLANDTDAENDFTSVAAVTATSTHGGTVTLTSGVITYTPPTVTQMADSFGYTLTDSRGATSTATVFLEIANRPPVATDLTLTRTNDQIATVTTTALLAASNDPDGDALSFVSVETTSALGATITKTGDTLTYTAASQTAIADEDYFLYTIQDAQGGTATGIITVQLLNRAPVAAAHNVGRFNTDAASIIPIANLVAGATDADLDLVTFDSVSALSTAGATLTVVGTDVVYTPASLPLNVEDTFTYTVKDPRGAIATGTVTMKLVNRAPVAGTNHVINRYNTEPGTIDVDTLLGSATDADGDTVTFVATSATSAQNATISVSAGVVTYTAAPLAITGDDTFTYTITDSRVATPVTGTVTVKLVNRAPLAGATIIQRHNDEPATITTAALINAASDPDSDPLTFVAAATTSAQGATISVNAGLITYTAASPTAIVGDDTFTYTITDSRVATPVTGTVTVKLLNRAPVGAADSVNRAAGEALSVSAATLLGNDSDADGDVITITAVSGTSAQGVPVVLTGTTITYTPNAAITGTDTFTYTVRDSKGLASEPVTVTVATTAPTTAPTLTVSNRAGGGAALQLKGVAFTSYVISVSTDLVTWTPLTTVTTNAQGLATAEDTTAPSDGAGRFYQADHN
ncbi:Ig-like domain-containing protein [Oleiharenicola lentus]|uniref:Ig-like domain-containing protein n=1 Tax=Oleiharenicola lentus TaxID=2508720 RepID=UPI003F661887